MPTSICWSRGCCEANGGYLILQLDELLDQPPSLVPSSRTPCKKGELDWNAYQEGKTLTPFFTPEATPIRFKLILVGDRLEVAEFQMLDRDMAERIFLRADLVSEVNIEEDFARNFCNIWPGCANAGSCWISPKRPSALCRHASPPVRSSGVALHRRGTARRHHAHGRQPGPRAGSAGSDR